MERLMLQAVVQLKTIVQQTKLYRNNKQNQKYIETKSCK